MRGGIHINFGKTLKKLRQEAGLTQGALAEQLGISPQTVSHWETGNAIPDISFVPMLTSVFDVSSDEILGITSERSDRRISKIIGEACRKMDDLDFAGAAQLLRNALRQYPRSYSIMERLATALIYVNSRQNITNYSEVIDLCNNVLDNCKDNKVWLAALNTVAIAYSYLGDKRSMLACVDQMPLVRHSGEVFMISRSGETDSGLRARQSYMHIFLDNLLETAMYLPTQKHDDGSPYYTDAEQLALLRNTVATVESIFPDGDYLVFAYPLYTVCGKITQIYLRMNDTECAAEWFEKECAVLEYMYSCSFSAVHTSPLFRGYNSLGSGWYAEPKAIDVFSVIERILKDEAYDVIRTDPRFEKSFTELTKLMIKKEK